MQEDNVSKVRMQESLELLFRRFHQFGVIEELASRGVSVGRARNESPAWAQNAADFGREARVLPNVLHSLERDDRIHRRVVERQIEPAPLDKAQILPAEGLLSMPDRFRIDLNSYYASGHVRENCGAIALA